MNLVHFPLEFMIQGHENDMNLPWKILVFCGLHIGLVNPMNLKLRNLFSWVMKVDRTHGNFSRKSEEIDGAFSWPHEKPMKVP